MASVSDEVIAKMQSILSAAVEARASRNDMLHQTPAQSQPQPTGAPEASGTPAEARRTLRRKGPGQATDRRAPDRVVRRSQVDKGAVHGGSAAQTPKTNGTAHQTVTDTNGDPQETAAPTTEETARDGAAILSTAGRVRDDGRLETSPLEVGTTEEWTALQPAPRTDKSYDPGARNGDCALPSLTGQPVDWSVKQPHPDHTLADTHTEDAVSVPWSNGAGQKHPLSSTSGQE